MPLPFKLPRIAGSSHRHWALRDKIAAAALFLATAAVVLWQNAQVSSGTSATRWIAPPVSLSAKYPIAISPSSTRPCPSSSRPQSCVRRARLLSPRNLCRVHRRPEYGVYLAHRAPYAARRLKAARPIALFLAAPLTVLGHYCIRPPIPPTIAIAPSPCSSLFGSCSALRLTTSPSAASFQLRQADFAAGVAI